MKNRVNRIISGLMLASLSIGTAHNVFARGAKDKKLPEEETAPVTEGTIQDPDLSGPGPYEGGGKGAVLYVPELENPLEQADVEKESQ